MRFLLVRWKIASDAAFHGKTECTDTDTENLFIYRRFPYAISIWSGLGWWMPAAPSALLPALRPPAAPHEPLPCMAGTCLRNGHHLIDLEGLGSEEITCRPLGSVSPAGPGLSVWILLGPVPSQREWALPLPH